MFYSWKKHTEKGQTTNGAGETCPDFWRDSKCPRGLGIWELFFSDQKLDNVFRIFFWRFWRWNLTQNSWISSFLGRVFKGPKNWMIIQSSFLDFQPPKFSPGISYKSPLKIGCLTQKKMMNHLPLEFSTVNSLWGFFGGKFIYMPWNCLWLPFWLEKSIPFFFRNDFVRFISSQKSLLVPVTVVSWQVLTRPELWGRFFHLPWWVLNGIKKWPGFFGGMVYFILRAWCH